MGKLGIFSGREACAISAKNGLKEVRRRGSHVVMQLKAEGATITVPVPDHKEIRKGTLQSIVRQSGLPRSKFEV